jgi:hypothetical protein
MTGQKIMLKVFDALRQRVQQDLPIMSATKDQP